MQLKVTSYEIENNVATIMLKRPGRRNSWTGRMHYEYRWCMEQSESDAGVRAIVVTGAGADFCVGADSRALEVHVKKGGYDPGTPKEMPRAGFGVRGEFDEDFVSQFGMTKPIVAAINGPVAGVGLAVACYADLRFAAAGAKFTTAHGALNLPAEFGLSWVLPRLMGVTAANDILLSSRVFLAEEAYELGLINQVLPREELLSRTYQYVRDMIARVSPGSLRATKRQIYADLHGDAANSVRRSRGLIDRMTMEPNYREGVAAFKEKRNPHWSVE